MNNAYWQLKGIRFLLQEYTQKIAILSICLILKMLLIIQHNVRINKRDPGKLQITILTARIFQ